MERRVKERLIGASILVTLLVLVVPELLSGPKPVAAPATLLPRPGSSEPEPVRTVTVDLASRGPAPADVPAIPLESGASSASVAPLVASPASEVQPSPEPAPVPPPARAAPAVQSNAWAVQLGSFANRANAENLVLLLKSQGFQVYDSAIGSGAAERFRVRVGPLADRGAADRTLAKLKSFGHAASVVSPGH